MSGDRIRYIRMEMLNNQDRPPEVVANTAYTVFTGKSVRDLPISVRDDATAIREAVKMALDGEASGTLWVRRDRHPANGFPTGIWERVDVG